MTSGGVLNLTGTVSSGPVFSINTFAATTLEFSGTATAAAAITVNNSNQTLEIASSGNLTITGGAESITNGTVQLAGGTLTSGLTIGSGATLSGFGSVTGAGHQQ